MKRLFIAFVAFCFFLMPSIAHACSCATGDPSSEFNGAKAVFIGRMLGGTETLSVKDNKGKTSQIEAGGGRFNVVKQYKGKISSKITIQVDSMEGTSCGDYGLKRGEIYVVYVYENDDGELYTGVCTRTVPVKSEYAKEDLQFLRKLPPVGTGGNLQGSIQIDARKEGGTEPFPDVKVRISGENGKIIVVTTDKDGAFELKGIKAGKYRVKPQLPKNYYVEEAVEEVKVADRGTANVSFNAYFTGRAGGRVTDKNGIAYNSLSLYLLSVNAGANQREIHGYTDGGDGAFSVKGVPPGEYVLYLELQHKDYNLILKYYYPGTYKPEEATVIQVGLDGKVEGLNFVLPEEFQVKTVEGQAFWKDGKPAADVKVSLLCPQSNNPNGYRIELMPSGTQTDKDGKFKLTGFSSENYRLEVRGFKGGKELHSPTKKIILAENLSDLKLILSESGSSGGCVD